MKWIRAGGRRRNMIGLGILGLIIGAALAAGRYMISMPGRSFRGELPPLNSAQIELRNRLKEHVQMLAEEIGERNLETSGSLTKAANYIEGELRKIQGNGVRRLEFKSITQTVANVELTLGGNQKSN